MKKAFTLVEMLTTIAIIAVLAGLVLSALRASLTSSKTVVCTSNLHQLQLAMTLYKQDAGDYPPSNERWPGFLPYLGQTELSCPFRDIAGSQDPPRLRVSYFLNGYMSYLSPAEIACRESRGPNFPLVYDSNHASPLVARSAGKRIYLYARVDGSIAREDARTADGFGSNPSSFPCPMASEFSNFK